MTAEAAAHVLTAWRDEYERVHSSLVGAGRRSSWARVQEPAGRAASGQGGPPCLDARIHGQQALEVGGAQGDADGGDAEVCRAKGAAQRECARWRARLPAGGAGSVWDCLAGGIGAQGHAPNAGVRLTASQAKQQAALVDGHKVEAPCSAGRRRSGARLPSGERGVEACADAAPGMHRQVGTSRPVAWRGAC